MTSATILLDDELDHHLKRLAAQQGRSAEYLLREAVAEYVLRHRGKSPQLSFVAAGRSGQSDVAERHEEIIESEWSGREGS